LQDCSTAISAVGHACAMTEDTIKARVSKHDFMMDKVFINDSKIAAVVAS